MRHALLLGDAHPGKLEAVGPTWPLTQAFASVSFPGQARRDREEGLSFPRLSCNHWFARLARTFLSYPVLARFLSSEVTPPGWGAEEPPLPVFPCPLRS